MQPIDNPQLITNFLLMLSNTT